MSAGCQVQFKKPIYAIAYCCIELAIFFSGRGHKTIAGTQRAYARRDGQATLPVVSKYLRMVTHPSTSLAQRIATCATPLPSRQDLGKMQKSDDDYITSTQ